MVDFPPPAPSAGWCRTFFDSLASGSSFSQAIVSANEKEASPRDFARYHIFDKHGSELTLSIAVEGGARQLRTLASLPQIQLSEHGNWRKMHLGALEACLGKTPFFRDILPLLEGIYLDKSITSLADFNSAIFNALFAFLMKNITTQELRQYSNDSLIRERAHEISRAIPPQMSVIQVIAIHGRESLLSFLSGE